MGVNSDKNAESDNRTKKPMSDSTSSDVKEKNVGSDSRIKAKPKLVVNLPVMENAQRVTCINT